MKTNTTTGKKILIFVVAYNAQLTISDVLHRIPEKLFQDDSYNTQVLVIDDASTDDTFETGKSIDGNPEKFQFLKNPGNLGYGGNQKLGYRFAIDNDFDYVALLHGDAQYPPEKLLELFSSLMEGDADAVFGSRMLKSKEALRGGMPFYKFIGNKVLTYIQNFLIGTNLSEWHSGYRLYSVSALMKIPFEHNSNDFDFDTDIIIQLCDAGFRIREIPVPTFYGDEVCHVNGVVYAFKILRSCLLFRIQKLGLLYQRKFDLESENHYYEPKFDFLSSHSLSLQHVSKDKKVVSFGCGPVNLVMPFIDKASELTVVDAFVSAELKSACTHVFQRDIDEFNFEELEQDSSDGCYDIILALDIIEHLKSPEKFLEKIRNSKKCKNSQLIITTPNVAFFPLRIMLLLGYFNYGKRGILDKTHFRLFTRGSLRKLLIDEGFEILESKGIPAPYPLAVGRNRLGRFLVWCNAMLIKMAPALFSYQIFVRCVPRKTVSQLLSLAKENTENV